MKSNTIFVIVIVSIVGIIGTASIDSIYADHSIHEHKYGLYLASESPFSCSLSNDWTKRLCILDLSYADLSGEDLQRYDWVGVDLTGADLSGANLSGTDLRKTVLTGADLSGADLSYANLRGADLSHADLSNVIFLNTEIYSVNLYGANYSEDSFNHVFKVPGGNESWKNMVKFTYTPHPINSNPSNSNPSNIWTNDEKFKTPIDCTLINPPKWDKKIERGESSQITWYNPDTNNCRYNVSFYHHDKTDGGSTENVKNSDTFSWDSIGVKYFQICPTNDKDCKSELHRFELVNTSISCALLTTPRWDKTAEVGEDFTINWSNPNPLNCRYDVTFYDSNKKYLGASYPQVEKIKSLTLTAPEDPVVHYFKISPTNGGEGD